VSSLRLLGIVLDRPGPLLQRGAMLPVASPKRHVSLISMAAVQSDQEPENPGFSVTEETAVTGTDETDSYQRVLDEVEVALDGVERALRRLDDGTYGTCEVCGRPAETEAGDLPTAGLRCSEHR
jgi:hypothetical protein